MKRELLREPDRILIDRGPETLAPLQDRPTQAALQRR